MISRVLMGLSFGGAFELGRAVVRDAVARIARIGFVMCILYASSVLIDQKICSLA